MGGSNFLKCFVGSGITLLDTVNWSSISAHEDSDFGVQDISNDNDTDSS